LNLHKPFLTAGFLQTAVSDAPHTTPESTCHSTRGASDTALAFLDSFGIANLELFSSVNTTPLPRTYPRSCLCRTFQLTANYHSNCPPHLHFPENSSLLQPDPGLSTDRFPESRLMARPIEFWTARYSTKATRMHGLWLGEEYSSL
jgi:hypothetical protein